VGDDKVCLNASFSEGFAGLDDQDPFFHSHAAVFFTAESSESIFLVFKLFDRFFLRRISSFDFNARPSQFFEEDLKFQGLAVAEYLDIYKLSGSVSADLFLEFGAIGNFDAIDRDDDILFPDSCFEGSQFGVYLGNESTFKDIQVEAVCELGIQGTNRDAELSPLNFTEGQEVIHDFLGDGSGNGK